MINTQSYNECLLADAVQTLNEVKDMDIRNQVIDALPQDTRDYLFSGYVLQEHYDCLKGKYDIVKSSNDLLHSIAQRFVD